MLDIHTVGAGGGSLARFDAGGALRVGPESAGADPGPIAYGRGMQPTVTDANLLLGRLRPDRFLGGEFALDVQRTERLTREWLVRSKSKLSLRQFAAGVIRVVNATMEKAIRVVSIERGHDPRDFALVAFGGAGGMHACELAEALAIPTVIVPALPGALSAFGILVSDVVKDYSRTLLIRARGKVPAATLENAFRALQKQSKKDFGAERWRGRIHHERSIDVRYLGQGYELNIPYTGRVLQQFHSAHRRRYGYSHQEREVELVTVRLRSVVKSPQQHLVPWDFKRRTGKAPQQASVVLDRERRIAVYERENLASGRKYRGPAIVTEYSATTVIPDKKKFWVDRAGNLMITIR